MAFRGSLAELPLTDILQLVAVSSKTGVITLHNADARGEIHIDKGRISHATSGPLAGEQAFFELARWLAGEFEFTQDAQVASRTIETSNTNLLLEAARQIDEWKLLAKKIGSTRMVLIFEPNASSSISLTPQEWAIVTRVDERRNIDEIAAALGHSVFETCKVVHGLLTSRVLALREDLRQLPLDRVRRLSGVEQDRLALEIHRVAAELLEEQHRSPDLDGALRLYRAEYESGRTFDALLDLVREAEKSVSGILGPHQARAFLDRVVLLLGGGESERISSAATRPLAPAVRPPEPSSPPSEPLAWMALPPLDLAKVRRRLAELTYQGLGPEGEVHVLRIERAKRAEELLKVATASRDLLRKIGKEEVAGAIEAELSLLA